MEGVVALKRSIFHPLEVREELVGLLESCDQLACEGSVIVIDSACSGRERGHWYQRS